MSAQTHPNHQRPPLSLNGRQGAPLAEQQAHDPRRGLPARLLSSPETIPRKGCLAAGLLLVAGKILEDSLGPDATDEQQASIQGYLSGLLEAVYQTAIGSCAFHWLDMELTAIRSRLCRKDTFPGVCAEMAELLRQFSVRAEIAETLARHSQAPGGQPDVTTQEPPRSAPPPIGTRPEAPPTDVVCWLGDRQYRIGSHPVVFVTEKEDRILLAFLDQQTMDARGLVSGSGYADAPKVLRALKTN